MEVEVFRTGDKEQALFQTSKTFMLPLGSSQDLLFDLELDPGDYDVKVTALGVDYTSQLGVGKAEGKPVCMRLT